MISHSQLTLAVLFLCPSANVFGQSIILNSKVFTKLKTC